MLNLLVFLCLVDNYLGLPESGSEQVCKNEKCSDGAAEDDPRELVDKAFKMAESQEKWDLFERVLELQPNNGNALVQLGMREFSMKEDMGRQEIAAERLARAFQPDSVPQIPVDSDNGQNVAAMLGHWHSNRREYTPAKTFLEKAAFSAAAKSCSFARLATFLTGFPESVQHAASAVQTYHTRMDWLLALDRDLAAEIPPGKGAEDIFGTCLHNPFDHSLYYESDARSALGKYIRLALRLFPELSYVSPHLRAPPVLLPQRRLRLGLASGFFSHASSVIDDFGGVLDRLPRERFEISFIYITEDEPKMGFNPVRQRFEKDSWMILKAASGWLNGARAQVAALDLDLLLYLDLTMVPSTHKLAMSRLARVQAVSHGHPMTSGIDKSVMNYYISWAAAELPTAQDHYTEELALLPAEIMHQYYGGRVTQDGHSAVSGQPFMQLTRQDFPIPESGHWYLCMQKPFKLHPLFDEMLAGVTKRDPEARIILHEVDLDALGFREGKHNKNVYLNRLRRAGVDLERVHFIGAQGHHALMALYRLSDVILDSYHAGGCTTTREALELAAPVVTLPSKYLGSRWSLAYYTIIGVLDLVAKDAEDYVAKAVHMASDKLAREAFAQKVVSNRHKLFKRPEPVEEWTKLLWELASKASEHHPPPGARFGSSGKGSNTGKTGKGSKAK